MSDFLEILYSDDGGNNYSVPRLLPLGGTGDFQRPLIARRMGITRGRQYEIRYSGDRRCDLLAVSVQAEGE